MDNYNRPLTEYEMCILEGKTYELWKRIGSDIKEGFVILLHKETDQMYGLPKEFILLGDVYQVHLKHVIKL